jgi:hypothetical protein
MSDELQTPAGAQPVPEQVVTATPDTEVEKPETTEVPEQKPAERVFTQAELDAEIGKRLARAQRKWEREQASKSQPASSAATDVPPIDQFESPEAYADALATKKAEELIAKREQAKQFVELREAYHDREEVAREKYDDFEQVAYNPRLRITDAMVEAIHASDVGPDVAYYLGSNPKEADRISRLSPTLQGAEIAKLEVKITSSPPVKRTTAAPSPITPVTTRSSSAPSYDTTDPRSTKALSVSEWIEAERQRQIRKMKST